VSVPPPTVPGWVTVPDLERLLGVVDAVEASRACAGANLAVAHRVRAVDWTAQAANPMLLEAAAMAAVDLYRRPKTAAGVYQVGELYARLPADLFTSIDAAIVASSADLEGGLA